MALVKGLFFDTSVLVAGIVRFRESPDAAQRLMDAVVQGRIQQPLTAWHCCLEFFSVVTRVPVEFRVEVEEAVRLVKEEIFARFRVRQLPAGKLEEFLESALEERVSGARIYDFHLVTVARTSGASTIVTDNPKHFRPTDGEIRVLTSEELVGELDR